MADKIAELEAWVRETARDKAFGCIIIHDDQMIAEWYGGGFQVDHLFHIGSIRKSFNSALVGIGLAQGTIDLNLRAYSVWPELVQLSGQEKDKDITLHHLMSAVSGWLTPEPPGKVYLYNNAGFTAAERVVARVYKMPKDEIAAEVMRVFKNALGAASWSASHWPKPFTPERYRHPGPKLAIDSTLRDLIKWGQLWLKQGYWDGKSLIPQDYVRLATSRVNPNVPDADYGYNWFLNYDQVLWPDAPADTFGHSGAGMFRPSEIKCRSNLIVCPSLKLVVAMVLDISSGFADEFLSSRHPITAELLRRVIRAVEDNPA